MRIMKKIHLEFIFFKKIENKNMHINLNIKENVEITFIWDAVIINAKAVHKYKKMGK